MFPFFQNRTLKRLFSLYTSNIDSISDESDDFLLLEKKYIYFILLKIKSIVDDKKTPILSEVINLCMENGADVEQIMGPVVLITYGTIITSISPTKKDNLIKTLISSNQTEIALVHGKQEAYVGNAGNNNRCSYGVVLNNISTILIELGKLNYGEVKEIQNA